MSPDKGGGGISTGGSSTSGKKKLALPADMFDKLLNAGTSDIKYAAAHRDIDAMRQMLATADVSTPKRKANADLLQRVAELERTRDISEALFAQMEEDIGANAVEIVSQKPCIDSHLLDLALDAMRGNITGLDPDRIAVLREAA